MQAQGLLDFARCLAAKPPYQGRDLLDQFLVSAASPGNALLEGEA
jgi:hypothetical protein